MTTLTMINKFSYVDTDFLHEVRMYFPYGVFNKHSFIKKVKVGQKFYTVAAEPGRNPKIQVEDFIFKDLKPYSRPKTKTEEGIDSFICIAEYSSGERLGIKKEFLVEELFAEANAVFLVKDELNVFAEETANFYSSILKATWARLWKYYPSK